MLIRQSQEVAVNVSWLTSNCVGVAASGFAVKFADLREHVLNLLLGNASTATYLFLCQDRLQRVFGNTAKMINNSQRLQSNDFR